VIYQTAYQTVCDVQKRISKAVGQKGTYSNKAVGIRGTLGGWAVSFNRAQVDRAVAKRGLNQMP